MIGFSNNIDQRDRLIRNIARRRTTDNRYVTDINSFWREELHARVENIPNLQEFILQIISQRIQSNVWGFPVDEQSISNTQAVFNSLVLDYFTFIQGRRVWVFTELDGYWTEDKIKTTFGSAFIMALWDIGSQLLIDNYPLVEDDLRHRTGRTSSADKRQNYHDSHNKLETGDNRENYHDSHNKLNTGDRKFTKQDNTRNKISEQNDGVSSQTIDGRTTSNTTNVQDVFNSPQDQGILPSSQSESIMNRDNEFQDPSNMGVEELTPNGNPNFTTMTQNSFEGSTDTNKEGRQNTSKDFHNRTDENDYIGADETTTSDIEGINNIGAKTGSNSNTQGINNIGAKVENDTLHLREEVLDISAVLQNFYDLFSERLLMEIDNRMLPYFLNMRIARFNDHRIGRKEYV
jgi:hypothetical protein